MTVSVGYLGIWVSGYLGIWVSGYLGIWVSGYLGIWVSGYLGIRVSGYAAQPYLKQQTKLNLEGLTVAWFSNLSSQ